MKAGPRVAECMVACITQQLCVPCMVELHVTCKQRSCRSLQRLRLLQQCHGCCSSMTCRAHLLLCREAVLQPCCRRRNGPLRIPWVADQVRNGNAVGTRGKLRTKCHMIVSHAASCSQSAIGGVFLRNSCKEKCATRQQSQRSSLAQQG
jgi:hypothetical protein